MQTGDMVRVKSTGKVGRVELIKDDGRVMVEFPYRLKSGYQGMNHVEHPDWNLELVEDKQNA